MILAQFLKSDVANETVRRMIQWQHRGGGNEDTGGNSNGGGTDNNQQSTKSGGGNVDGNGNNDSNDNNDGNKGNGGGGSSLAAAQQGRQLGGGGLAAAAAVPATTATLPPHTTVVVMKTPAATAMAGAQTTLNNQLNAVSQAKASSPIVWGWHLCTQLGGRRSAGGGMSQSHWPPWSVENVLWVVKQASKIDGQSIVKVWYNST